MSTKEKILLAGGTGLVGKHLSSKLTAAGYEVRILTRSPKGRPNHFAWDLSKKTIDLTAFAGVNHIINLTGAGIVDKRWSAKRREVIIKSRVDSNELLIQKCQELQVAPSTFVTASAVGIYGDQGDVWMDETDQGKESDFMVTVCKKWEQSLFSHHLPETRSIAIRIGLVLSTLDGVLPKLLMSFRFGLGIYFGSGQQYYSWIHIDDLAGIFQHAIENPDMEGVYNGVAPEPQTNRALVRAIRSSGRPALLLPIPAFVLKLVMGAMSATVLNSNRVSSSKIEKAGFSFNYPTISKALVALLN